MRNRLSKFLLKHPCITVPLFLVIAALKRLYSLQSAATFSKVDSLRSALKISIHIWPN